MVRKKRLTSTAGRGAATPCVRPGECKCRVLAWLVTVMSWAAPELEEAEIASAVWVSLMEDPLDCLSNKETVKAHGSGVGERQQTPGQNQVMCDFSGIFT